MKLSDYLATNEISRTDFARKIAVSQSYVTQLCQGIVWPGREIAERIAAETNNEVTANDFLVLRKKRRVA